MNAGGSTPTPGTGTGTGTTPPPIPTYTISTGSGSQVSNANTPNPQQIAAGQTAGNLSAAMAQQLMNQQGQQTPYGSLSYQHTQNTSYFDPVLGKNVTIPQFTAKTTLSPTQQALLNQEEEFDKTFNQTAIQQANAVKSHYATPFNYDTGAHEAWAGDLYGKMNNDTNARNSDMLDTKLKNQGLSPGTPAYDDAMRNLTYGQEKGRNDFMLNAYNTGMNTALTERNQPLNEMSSLMGGGQITQPTFQPAQQTNIQSADVQGALTNQLNQKLAEDAAKKSGLLGGLSSLGSAVINAGGWALSDRRAKKNIAKVGKLNDGTGIYAYKYKGDGSGLMQLGVMAQEAEKNHPEAVAERPDGLKEVNYSRIAEALA